MLFITTILNIICIIIIFILLLMSSLIIVSNIINKGPIISNYKAEPFILIFLIGILYYLYGFIIKIQT